MPLSLLIHVHKIVCTTPSCLHNAEAGANNKPISTFISEAMPRNRNNYALLMNQTFDKTEGQTTQCEQTVPP